jgi:hypothetical protein
VWNYSPALGDHFRGGTGWTASGSDVDRIPRQQYFLRTLAQTAINRTDDNPVRILALVPAVMSHLSTDQNLTLGELKSLVHTFRNLKPADIEMTTLPWSTDPADRNRLVVDHHAADPLLFRLANFTATKPFLPPLVDPRTVRVRVVNGSGVAGLGDRALSALVAAGFRSAGPVVDTDRANYARTQVRWAPNREAKGVTITYATAAKVSGEAVKVADTLGGDVLVVVGRDWPALHHHLTDLVPKPTTSTVAGATTTTTTVRVDSPFVPVDPKTGGVLVGCPKA